MFGFLKKLAFWKKKKAEEQPSQSTELPSSTQSIGQTEQIEPKPTGEIPVKSVAQPKTQEPGREEKLCPKCGAPNDKFVHVCWLCKAEI